MMKLGTKRAVLIVPMAFNFASSTDVNAVDWIVLSGNVIVFPAVDNCKLPDKKVFPAGYGI